MLRFVLGFGLLALVAGCQCGPASTLDGGEVGGGAGGGSADASSPDAATLTVGGAPDAGNLDAGVLDAGPLDAGALDAGPLDAGALDAGALDAGAPSDPALCPVGVADGCCPLLVHGGTDPDCKPLSCTSLVESAIIDLVDDPWATWQGQTALAWNGRDLVLARTVGHAATPNPIWEVVTEHRSLDGGLVSSNHVPTPGIATAGATSLGYDPQTHTYLFAHSVNQAIEVLALDEAGAIRWHAGAHVICNGEDAIVQVDASHGRFFVTGTNYTCAGSTGLPVAYGFDADAGTPLFDWHLSNDPASWHSSAACDLDCAHLLTQWFPSNPGIVRGNLLDLGASAGPDGGFSMQVNASYGGVDHTALTSNGTEFFSMLAVVGSANGSSQLRFQKFAGTQWVGSPVTLAAQRALPPSAIWTGDGWLIAASTFTLSTSYAFPTSHSDYDVTMYHFDAAGALRGTWVFEHHAYGPKLAWAGGRIAMTFTRAAPGTAETRHLVFFDCP
jgi:hypothetical protein